MKKYLIYAGLAFLTGFGCKESPKPETAEQAQTPKPKNLLEKLAEKHGYGHWQDVAQIRFTFNVDRGGNHFERTWIWDPRENRVTRITDADTLTFLRASVDSTLMQADAAFINDKYWLLAPYQWVWDQQSFSHTFEQEAEAPISGTPMQKLTIVYGSEGGYTPGDAYDFYLDRDSVLREWVYRKGNQPEPSLATTWDAYETQAGLKLSLNHENADKSFRLYFTGVQVETD